MSFPIYFQTAATGSLGTPQSTDVCTYAPSPTSYDYLDGTIKLAANSYGANSVELPDTYTAFTSPTSPGTRLDTDDTLVESRWVQR